jgi:hypothetical protein
VTEILRSYPVKFFYISPGTTTFNYSVFPVSVTTGAPDIINSAFSVNIYPLTISGVNPGISGNQWA